MAVGSPDTVSQQPAAVASRSCFGAQRSGLCPDCGQSTTYFGIRGFGVRERRHAGRCQKGWINCGSTTVEGKNGKGDAEEVGAQADLPVAVDVNSMPEELAGGHHHEEIPNVIAAPAIEDSATTVTEDRSKFCFKPSVGSWLYTRHSVEFTERETSAVEVAPSLDTQVEAQHADEDFPELAVPTSSAASGTLKEKVDNSEKEVDSEATKVSSTDLPEQCSQFLLKPSVATWIVHPHAGGHDSDSSLPEVVDADPTSVAGGLAETQVAELEPADMSEHIAALLSAALISGDLKKAADDVVVEQGFLKFTYTWEEHLQTPLAKYMECERLRIGVTEEDWQLRLEKTDREGFFLDLESPLYEESFPVDITWDASGKWWYLRD